MKPEKPRKPGSKSYTVQYKEFKVRVNLAKKSFWIYGGQLETRNFVWGNNLDPKGAWQKPKNGFQFRSLVKVR